MTIHHDKLAYGKLASNMEELSEDRIAEMLSELCREAEAPDEANKNSENIKEQ